MKLPSKQFSARFPGHRYDKFRVIVAARVNSGLIRAGNTLISPPYRARCVCKQASKQATKAGGEYAPLGDCRTPQSILLFRWVSLFLRLATLGAVYRAKTRIYFWSRRRRIFILVVISWLLLRFQDYSKIDARGAFEDELVFDENFYSARKRTVVLLIFFKRFLIDRLQL